MEEKMTQGDAECRGRPARPRSAWPLARPPRIRPQSTREELGAAGMSASNPASADSQSYPEYWRWKQHSRGQWGVPEAKRSLDAYTHLGEGLASDRLPEHGVAHHSLSSNDGPWAHRSPRFLSASNRRHNAELATKEANVMDKLRELQALVRSKQEERDALDRLVIESERQRVEASRASAATLQDTERRAWQVVDALAVLQDDECSRAALRSACAESGLSDECQRLKDALLHMSSSKDLLHAQLDRGRASAAELEAEARRCKARVMTESKEKQRLSVDNVQLERRVRHAGLALADEQQRQQRLQEEVGFLSLSLDRSRRLEQQLLAESEAIRADILALRTSSPRETDRKALGSVGGGDGGGGSSSECLRGGEAVVPESCMLSLSGILALDSTARGVTEPMTSLNQAGQ